MIRLYCFEFYGNKICFFFFIKSYIHIDIKYLTYYEFYIEKFHVFSILNLQVLYFQFS